MKRNTVHNLAPLYLQPLRWLTYACVAVYHRIAFRIRMWGRLPVRRGPTIVVANHQHEIESPVVVADLAITSLSWRYPIFTASSRRMFEPGFFAERIPWLTIFRTVNLGGLFASIGMQPIENELSQRPFGSIAFFFSRDRDPGVREIFTEKTLERIPPDVRTLRDILAAKHFSFARSYVRMNEIREPHRTEIMRAMRGEIERDIEHFENLVRDGATVFLTPEGFYTGDGRMQRLRGILSRLAPLAATWLAAISYDPYDERRLTMLYRVLPAPDGVAIDLQLKGSRPVTTSALVCTYLASHPEADLAEVLQGVKTQLAALPRQAFVVPELRADPRPAVERVLRNIRAFGRKHPQFPRTPDMIEYQRNFHEETLDGLTALAASAGEHR